MTLPRLLTRVTPVVLTGVVLALLAPPTAFAQQPDFSGGWERNAEMSQFWREPYEGAERTTGGAWMDPDTRRLVARVEEMLQLAETIEIEQDERRLVFRVAGSGSRIFYFNRDHRRQTVYGVDIEASMDWDDADLIITETTDDGTTLTERLTRLSDDQIAHLLVWEDSRLFREPVSIRSVYDRAAD
jgi:hypothetical protein